MVGEAHHRGELVGVRGSSLTGKAYLCYGIRPPRAELEVFHLPYWEVAWRVETQGSPDSPRSPGARQAASLHGDCLSPFRTSWLRVIF